MGKKGRFDLYGPPGTAKFCRLLLGQVYPYARKVVGQIRKEGLEVAPHEATEGLVCRARNYRVLSARMEHGIPAIGFRIESGESTVVISGDTRPSKSLIKLAKGADLLIHECSFPDDMIDFARTTHHSVPSEVGEVADQAGVKKLVLTHLFPHGKGREREMVRSAKSKFSGSVVAGHDLLEINV